MRASRVLALVCIPVVALVAWVGPSAGSVLVVSRPLSSPDLVVSLASHEWERLPETARLARQYPKALVALTLPAEVNEYNCHDCSQRAAYLISQGVDERRIQVLPIPSPGTYGEAEAVRTFAARQPIRQLLVVTSPYHTRRALATFDTVFRGTGVEVGIDPASATSPARPDAWWQSPYDRWYVRYEWAAILYYEVRHGVNALASRSS